MKLGYGFGDNIGFSNKRPKTRDEFLGEEESSETNLNLRLKSLYFLLAALTLIIFVRLFYLQVAEGKRNRLIAEENRIRVKTLPAPRGVVTDRNGEVLVRNIPGYRLRVEGSPVGFKPISRDEALQVEAKGGTEAANLEVDVLREYIYPEVTAHVLGYTSEIGQEELNSGPESYELGDKIGRTGIEKEYEGTLKGKKGEQFVEVDAGGNKLNLLGEVAPQPGQNLALTIDFKLQKKAHEALGAIDDSASGEARSSFVRKGAVVVSDPRTGEILALISHPSFNSNLFTLGQDQGGVGNLFDDKGERPLFNRAISGLYPPGSTFKIITAAAGLETGKINPKTQVEDVGEIVIGPYRFPNWFFIQYGKTEGVLDIVRAIARSNDIFFYKVAEWVGEENLAQWAKKFGLGQKLGIDLEGESDGLIPTDAWKQENIGEKWYLGDTYHFGIGQGYLLATPLQMNAWTSVIASGGTLWEPHLVKNQKSKIKNQNFLKKETIDLIKEGMREACAPGGTGWPLFKFKVKSEKLKVDEKNFFLPEEATVSGKTDGLVEIPVACKTGTAEYGDLKGKTHAWFTVFAPVENPQIVVTVLVEGGGEGSSVAAPVAKKILEEYFSK
ncbi:MAG: penicillin-binding protein 2 [bacterium]|nr:penicillin-binding protein 2 [bacterium]